MDTSEICLPQWPVSTLERLETLWLQLTGLNCNLSCPSCYVGSHPENNRLPFMTFDQVRVHCEQAHRMGVRRIVLTGGEPLLHPGITDIINMTRHFAPTVIMTNGTLLNPHHLFKLKHTDDGLFPVEFHVSLDGYNQSTHDAVRGAGMFYKALAGIELLRDYGMTPVIRVVKTWKDLDESVILSNYRQLLRDLDMPLARVRVQPLFPSANPEAPNGKHKENLPPSAVLPCRTSRLVSSAGVHACPMRLDAWLGDSLESTVPEVRLNHQACRVCESMTVEI